jgi:hypothetical protein
LYGCAALARESGHHANEAARTLASCKEEIVDFYDGSIYPTVQQHNDRNYRDLFFALSFDGYQPFVDDQKYSMWPLVLTPYNFHPKLRYELGVTHVCGIISGTRSKEVKLDMRSFLGIICDEISYYQKYGIDTYDAHRDENFMCKPYIVKAVTDFRGLEKFLNIPGSPAYFGCLK